MTTETKPMLDLRLTHVVYKIGDIIAMVTWNIQTGKPCIVLVPKADIHFERMTPCVVPLSKVYLWAEETGDGAHCVRTSFMFASALGRNPHDPKTLYRITAIIRDMLQDLVEAPPLPNDLREITAEMTVTDQATGRITEKEVSDHV